MNQHYLSGSIDSPLEVGLPSATGHVAPQAATGLVTNTHLERTVLVDVRRALEARARAAGVQSENKTVGVRACRITGRYVGGELEVEIGAEGYGLVGDFFVGVTLGSEVKRILPQLIDAFTAHVIERVAQR